MPSLKNAVLLLYNTILLISHFVIFNRVVYSGFDGSFDYSIFFGFLVIITSLQYFDIILSLSRLTKSNPVMVLVQVTGRLFVLYTATKVIGWAPAVFSLVVIYLLSELCRGPYYISVCLGDPNELLTWLRYNAFRVLYPIGFTCEALVFANVFLQAYRENTLVSSTGTDYFIFTVIAFFTFFISTCLFLYNSMARQAYKKNNEATKNK